MKDKEILWKGKKWIRQKDLLECNSCKHFVGNGVCKIGRSERPEPNFCSDFFNKFCLDCNSEIIGGKYCDDCRPIKTKVKLTPEMIGLE